MRPAPSFDPLPAPADGRAASERRWIDGRRALLGLVSVASLLAGLAAVEVCLRATRSVHALFEHIQVYPELASEGWQRVFLQDYPAIVQRGHLGEGLGGDRHDPVLGWDTPTGIRGPEVAVAKPAWIRRIVVVGDSFTYGDEVAEHEAFPRLLQSELSGVEVLNLGVRAYCVGQAYLKLATTGRRYAPDLVIFAVYGPDLLRTRLRFYRFAKPRFDAAVEGVSLSIEGVPIAGREEVYRSLRDGLSPLLWTYGLLRHAVLSSEAWRRWSGYETRFRLETDAVHERIFGAAKELAAEIGSTILFLYVPDAREFAAPEDAGWERASFARVSSRAGVRTLDLVEELARMHGSEEVHDEFYLWKEGMPGHLSPKGHRAVARVLGRYLRRHHLPGPPGLAVSGP